MELEVSYIDAFTDSIFGGNPAAVILIEDWLSDDLMQSIAAENNLSETAFSVKKGDTFHIRWFSPLTEIDFCGHATLATAYVLFNKYADFDALEFYAKAIGEFNVCRADSDFIKMSFPNRKPVPVDIIPDALMRGLSITPDEVLLSQQAYFAVYSSEEDVLTVKQDKEHLKELKPYDVVVTSASKDYDFISRYFWPANGGDEDPVTGSIHAGLAPFWAERLGKSRLQAFQASKRGGHLFCTIDGDRVGVSGKAVKYMSGTISV